MPDRSFLDWPFFELRHRELAASLDDWCLHNLTHVDEGNIDDTCRRLVKQLAKDDWLRFAIPHPAPFDVRSICLTREILARHEGLADFAFAMQGLGTAPIALFASDAVAHKYLPRARSGDLIAAFALTEPDAGSDVAAMATSAREEAGEFILDGLKTWVSNGGIADFYIVFARTGEAQGAKGLSAFIVEANTPGLHVEERIEVMAPHPLATIRFESCRVPAENLLGSRGEGFKVAMTTLDIFRASVGAAALGFARRALDEALGRACERNIFGAPLSQMQMTQSRLAKMATAVDASALLVYRAAWAKDVSQQRASKEVSMAKLFATEEAQQVIDMALQIFGGLGVKKGMTVERLYREIRPLRIYEGASEVQEQIIAKQLLAQFQENSNGGS